MNFTKKVSIVIALGLCIPAFAATKKQKKTSTELKAAGTPTVKPTAQKRLPVDRTITVNNNIEKKMTGYKYVLKTYYPSDFKIIVNGKEVALGSNAKIPVKNNKLFVRYCYDFSPYKTGTKEVELDVEPSATGTDLTFSWKNEWRIIASNTTPIAVKEITA